MKVIDLVGLRFGRLLVLKRAITTKKRVYWVCLCNCGNICEKLGAHLKAGYTKSCGCLNIEKIIERRRLEEPWLVTFNYIVRNYKYRAKQKNISFSLSKNDCLKLFKGNCFYCGIPPSNSVNVYIKKDGTCNRDDILNPEIADFIHNGIDRVDNTQGYTINNCCSCCCTCNYTKIDLSIAQWNHWLNNVCDFKFQPALRLTKFTTCSIPKRQLISFNSLITSYRETASRRNLDFDLSRDECLTLFKANCYYCGGNPSLSKNPYLLKDGNLSKTGQRHNFSFDPSDATFIFNGIDRKNSLLGYTLIGEQVVPCCNICNTGKRDLPYEEWISHLERVSIYQNQKRRKI